MGETLGRRVERGTISPFSILKRIVMGETIQCSRAASDGGHFQYPQADRDG